jgi:septal ring factor EnvC (AmiA/AmiB activator)
MDTMRVVSLALLAFLSVAGTATAQEVPAPGPLQQLQELERALELSRQRQQELARQAARLAQELGTLRAQLVIAAEAVQVQEARITAITTRLEVLRVEEAARSEALVREHRDLAQVLASLARLSRQPPATMVAGDGAALDLVRSSLLLAAVVPGLQERARDAVHDLQTIRALRIAIDEEQAGLADARAQRENERKRLAVLLEQKGAEQARTQTQANTERDRIGRMAAEAQDLRELLGRLDAEPGLNAGPPEGTRPFAQARGRLPLPARGKVIRSWGDIDPLGFPARGLTVEIVADAQVVAPYDGRIVFADAFRSYGQLLIISHGGGYHTLIAGLYRIDGQVGQWLLAGEPVGQASHGENGKSTLYVELRRNGEPINPLPWLAAR